MVRVLLLVTALSSIDVSASQCIIRDDFPFDSAWNTSPDVYIATISELTLDSEDQKHNQHSHYVIKFKIDEVIKGIRRGHFFAKYQKMYCNPYVFWERCLDDLSGVEANIGDKYIVFHDPEIQRELTFCTKFFRAIYYSGLGVFHPKYNEYRTELQTLQKQGL